LAGIPESASAGVLVTAMANSRLQSPGKSPASSQVLRPMEQLLQQWEEAIAPVGAELSYDPANF